MSDLTPEDQYDEWRTLSLSERMRSDIAMASAYADEVRGLEHEWEVDRKRLEALENQIERVGGVRMDIAVVEFCYGDPLRWLPAIYIGPDRECDPEDVWSSDLVGLTGVRVRYLDE